MLSWEIFRSAQPYLIEDVLIELAHAQHVDLPGRVSHQLPLIFEDQKNSTSIS